MHFALRQFSVFIGKYQFPVSRRVRENKANSIEHIDQLSEMYPVQSCLQLTARMLTCLRIQPDT